MEVKPVVAVVAQKLTDTLNDASVADNIVMRRQLKGIQKSLKNLQSFSKEKDVSEASRRATDHLRVLYDVEDEIEKFAFQVARQRKKFGFLMKQTFIFNNLNSCRRLKRKIKKIHTQIPSSSQHGSVRTISDVTTSEECQADDDDFSHESQELPRKSSSHVWVISEIPSTPSPRLGFLTRSFTMLLHPEKIHMSNFSSEEEELGVFGLNDDIKSLVKWLTQPRERNISGFIDTVNSPLKRLRHLNLNNIRLAMPPSSSLTLLTLWGLVLDEKISVNEGLGKLLDLRELGIKFNLRKSTQGVLLDWIAKLRNLQSLRLTSVDDMGRPSNLLLKPLVNLDKLSHLNLYGNLERLPAPNEFPPTLKVLTLSISKLNKDPMETLEQLPSLIVLRLLGDSSTGKRLVCHSGGFKKLEVLKVWKLKELEEIDVEEKAMESLKELDIRCCHNLNDITSRLLQKQRCLEELVLTDMPDDFVGRIKKKKSKYTSLTINPWKLAY
ncbi:hypothetical protein L2E82_21456 [Cichorium intybus]|uniref:Uncharacterized protein n=1 Tax=Cichorium intybus TaxID=13427 RepID=A0ACB9DW47_CICIN|nr:hypothetical protein L2E82_21456 [Cichorium intybus]